MSPHTLTLMFGVVQFLLLECISSIDDDLGDSIFVSLKSITGVTDCLNEACTDTDLVWGDGSALEYNSEVYGEVLFEPSSSARCTRLDTSPTFTPELADLSYEECTTPRPTACQTDCMPRKFYSDKVTAVFGTGCDSWLQSAIGVLHTGEPTRTV